MTDTQPRLSTAFKSFMTAFSFAIFWVPIACTMVTIELSASGIAATARATANIRESMIVLPCQMDKPNTSAQITIMMIASLPENLSRLCCRGVFFSLAAFISAAILPISVFIPVPVTTTIALP